MNTLSTLNAETDEFPVEIQKESGNRNLFLVGLIVVLLIVLTSGFAWMRTDHVIAPPSVRILTWLWKVFVCRCPD